MCQELMGGGRKSFHKKAKFKLETLATPETVGEWRMWSKT